jgi:phosphoglycerol transferase MdoB-like AlkP superfamily enzyme
MALLPILLIVALEFMQRSTMESTLAWIMDNKGAFSISYFLVLAITIFLLSLTNSVMISIIFSSFIVVIIGLVNLSKYNILGQPFFPWDIFLYDQVVDLLPVIYKDVNFRYLTYGVIFLGILICIRRVFPVIKMSWYKRGLIAIASVFFILSICFFPHTPLKYVFEKLKVDNIVSIQDLNYRRNGTILAFFMNIPSAIVVSPNGYSEAKINQISSQIQSIPVFSNYPENLNSINPNIILVMSEAFWDPQKLPRLSFSSDPIPTTRKNLYGWVLSPEFGGNTANVEFEALTGMSMNFLPSGSVPYQQYVKKPLPTIASTLKERGYHTVAIHTFTGAYWNRDKVYDLFGFEDFISMEKFDNPIYKGPFIADSEITKKIVQQVQKDEEPVFVFAVTMQNHAGYTDPKRYGKNTIQIEGNISMESIDTLETYSQGAADADLELKNLLDYFSKSSEPTMIVYFGDHLPFLGKDHYIYRETNFVASQEKQWSLDEKQIMKCTPLAIWKNYGETTGEISTISPSFLPPIIFQQANIKLPPYYSFLKEFYSSLPGYTKQIKVDSKGKQYKATPSEYGDLENNYRLLQYDLLFGNQYSKDYLYRNE